MAGLKLKPLSPPPAATNLSGPSTLPSNPLTHTPLFVAKVPYTLALPLGASDLIPQLIETSVKQAVLDTPQLMDPNGMGISGDMGFITEIMAMANAASAEAEANAPSEGGSPDSRAGTGFDAVHGA